MTEGRGQVGGGFPTAQVAAQQAARSSHLLYSEPLHSFLPGERALPSRPFSDFRFICEEKAS